MDFTALLAAAGLTKAEAARYLGVSRMAVTLWCQGKRQPSPAILAKMISGWDKTGTAKDPDVVPAATVNSGPVYSGSVNTTAAWLSAAEAVIFVGCAERTLRRWEKAGSLDVRRVPCGCNGQEKREFSRTSLEEMKATLTAGGTATATEKARHAALGRWHRRPVSPSPLP